MFIIISSIYKYEIYYIIGIVKPINVDQNK